MPPVPLVFAARVASAIVTISLASPVIFPTVKGLLPLGLAALIYQVPLARVGSPVDVAWPNAAPEVFPTYVPT